MSQAKIVSMKGLFNQSLTLVMKMTGYGMSNMDLAVEWPPYVESSLGVSVIFLVITTTSRMVLLPT